MMFNKNETLEEARQRNVRDALMEDIGQKDWTAQLVLANETVHARVIVKQADAVLCGRDWFDGCFHALDPDAQIIWHYQEGEHMAAQTTVCDIKANGRAMLSAERPALNFLQSLSWTATTTQVHVKAIEGISPNPKGCAILDTRKTIPGLRQAQKYAVRIGGGKNQRMALWQGILIKENHIAAAGGIPQVLAAAFALNSGVDIQIEVESISELELAIANGAKNVLIDDFSISDMKRAVEINQGQALLEVSGGVTLDRLKEIAATGVDRISIGKLTKDIIAVDYSMRVIDRII
jgi:nicotinate-nucleotide pyrophosphorylase (carboxylating)